MDAKEDKVFSDGEGADREEDRTKTEAETDEADTSKDQTDEVASLRDAALRARAEAENVRKRAKREVADAKRYGAQKLVTDLLDLADNFERAIAAIPDEKDNAVKEGLVAMSDELMGIFNKHGVEKIEAEGEKFDPELHEALSQVPAADGQAPGTVAQVYRNGYRWQEGGRLIRPAQVLVAK